ncbi:helix-turn-helix domain-containing protein [Noviherbaspirillum pedocola]|uniref:Helix-turn-helix domain-containing protein n=1 Tax=Noviherbaspirillum pedocola TaxID=2801341 RepID=A0A934SW14_9BURK|nr:helix-turn-helix domain-containing protein [Noviherbaspirillum pedocola]MBK4737866.1 helix-turn-helix domain-containing protein [Noviherbaspirillum pedocola]
MSEFRLTRAQERRLVETLRRTHDVRQYRRSLAVLECGRGKPVNEVAAALHVTRQSIHNWVTRYRHAGQCTALADRVHRGRPRRADRTVDAFLQELLQMPPAQCGYHATHWTVSLLQDQLRQHLNQAFCDATVRRVLHRLGYVWKRPRYVLAADAQREKKVSYPARAWQLTAAQCRAGGG